MEPRPVHVYVIAGSVRSGSTLLSSLLARETHGFDCGELHLLWRSFDDGRQCTCGAAVPKCEVWSEVSRRVLAALELSSPAAAAKLHESDRGQWRLLSPRFPAPQEDLLNLRRETEQAVAAVTGAAVLVDSSKLPTQARLALSVNRHATVVHLLRDPRAVAFSLSRPHSDPSMNGALMPSLKPSTAALTWALVNLAMERISSRWPAQVKTALYEDLVRDSPELLSRIVCTTTACGTHEEAASRRGHAIAGNPSRFTPERPVRKDDRWLEGLPRRDRRVVEAITWPLRGRYGYT